MPDKRRSLKSLRIDKGVSAVFVAKMLGITRQTLSNKEAGKTEWLGIEVQKLCKFYNVQIEELKL